jgi:hypothetical protein
MERPAAQRAREAGIDLSLTFTSMRERTPTERLAENQAMLEFIDDLQAAVKHARDQSDRREHR